MECESIFDLIQNLKPSLIHRLYGGDGAVPTTKAQPAAISNNTGTHIWSFLEPSNFKDLFVNCDYMKLYTYNILSLLFIIILIIVLVLYAPHLQFYL